MICHILSHSYVKIYITICDLKTFLYKRTFFVLTMFYVNYIFFIREADGGIQRKVIFTTVKKIAQIVFKNS